VVWGGSVVSFHIRSSPISRAVQVAFAAAHLVLEL
jgi:hypothetical protein